MRRKHRAKPATQQKLALERIRELFKLARDAYKDDKMLSNRYVSLARRIGMRYKVKIPKDLQKKFCKHCYVYLFPGINCRIRTKPGKVVYYCHECKKFMRFLHN